MSCPICRKPTVADWRPFCSRRCADIDLGKWMSGAYAIPFEDPDDIAEVVEATAEAESAAGEKPH